MLKQAKKYRITIVFYLHDEVGSLLSILEIFKKFNVNLSRIISMPDIEKEWQYKFFIEIEVNIGNERINECLREIKSHTKNLSILGRYPLKNIDSNQ